MLGFAQSVPQGINYQALARDASGAVLMNQALTIQFSVISDITTSAVSWQETHTVSTNDYGLYTAIIGQGTSTNVGSSLTFDVIDWGASNHLLKVDSNCKIYNPVDVNQRMVDFSMKHITKDHTISNFELINQNGEIITNKNYENKILKSKPWLTNND